MRFITTKLVDQYLIQISTK